MKKYILMGIVGVLLPLIVNGQTTTFITTIGSPNGIFSNLEVKGLELKGNAACCEGECTAGNNATCSATVTKVEKVEFLSSVPTVDNTGTLYLPISKSTARDKSRPANLGNVILENGSTLTGDVREVRTSLVSDGKFHNVIIPNGSEFHVRHVDGGASSVSLDFTPWPPDTADVNPVNPFLTAGVLEATGGTNVKVTAMALDRIWAENPGHPGERRLVFREHQQDAMSNLYDPGNGGGTHSQWRQCGGGTGPCSCFANGTEIVSGAHLLSGSGDACEKYYILQVTPTAP